jgi:hypothetical protein
VPHNDVSVKDEPHIRRWSRNIVISYNIIIIYYNTYNVLTSLLYNEYRVSPGGKVRPGCDADPAPPSSPEMVKNIVELYLYSP